MGLFLSRVVRAIRLDKEVFEEVEADQSAMFQAVLVVVLASVAGGIGLSRVESPPPMLVGAISSLVSWVVWASVTWLIGTRLLPSARTSSSVGELMRTLGFAYSPVLLNVFGIIPGLGWILRAATAVWMLMAWVIAVRQALDYESTGRAALVCVIGWLVVVLLNVILRVMGLAG